MSKPNARRPYANFVVLDVFFTNITVLSVEVHHRLVESTTYLELQRESWREF